MRVIPIDVPELGNRSYIVHDGTEAIVIDPSRRIQQIIDIAEKEHVTLAAIFETHIHNDYITGGFALAQKLKIPYYVSADEHVSFTHESIAPDQSITVGNLAITAIAAPGHTYHHLGYLASRSGIAPAFFSGGSVLYGAVGRPDLVSDEDTQPLAEAQYQTAQHLLKRLHPSTKLFPTHGFGSFCAASQTEDVSVSTFARQLKTNPVYTATDATVFVKDLIDSLDAYPAYYAYMAPANAKEPLLPKIALPAQLTREALVRALHSGAGIVDMRTRTAYAAQHLPGTYNIEASNDLATYVGWIIAWDAPLILVAETEDAVNTAQEQLSLIGRDIVEGHITPSALLTDAARSYPIRTFKDLAALPPVKQPAVLDVRRNAEWQKSHVKDAVHIPVHELHDKLSGLKKDKAVWVYCTSGFRASIATSILANHGVDTVLIDDTFSSALKLGLVPVARQPFVDEVEAHSAQLLDVRDSTEWDTGHAQGAQHMPLGRIMGGDLGPLDLEKPVYIYCETGERSGMAEDFLRSMGFTATNIGSLDDWLQAGGAYEELD